MCLTSNSRPQCKMTSMSAHHFNNLYPAVRSRRSARAFYDFGNIPEGSIKTQRVIRRGQIFVDRLGDTYDCETFLMKFGCNAKCVLTTARDDRIEFKCLGVLQNFTRQVDRITLFVDL